MIYFIQAVDGGPIKIGTTVRLTERLRALSREFGKELRVLAVTDGSYDQEKALHQRFAHLNVVNELFEPGDDLLGFIVQRGRQWDGKDEATAREPVRIDADVLDDIRAVTGFNKLPISQYISDILRPIVRKDLERYARRVLDKGAKAD